MWITADVRCQKSSQGVGRQAPLIWITREPKAVSGVRKAGWSCSPVFDVMCAHDAKTARSKPERTADAVRGRGSVTPAVRGRGRLSSTDVGRWPVCNGVLRRKCGDDGDTGGRGRLTVAMLRSCRPCGAVAARWRGSSICIVETCPSSQQHRGALPADDTYLQHRVIRNQRRLLETALTALDFTHAANRARRQFHGPTAALRVASGVPRP